MRTTPLVIVASLACLVGCTTPLTEAGAKVELITPAQAQNCEMLKLFQVQGASPDDVLHQAQNQVVELGGDSVGISDGQQTGHGDVVTAVALRCHTPRS
ncbi:hypothetical protein [Pseudomonas sp. TE3610]